MFEFGALFSAFFAGLLGSGHCFGMCGGIAAGLGNLPLASGESDNRQPGKRFVSAVLFNLGRLISYALLGLLAAWLMAVAGSLLNVPNWGRALRLVTAVMIFLIGLQFLIDRQILGFIEKLGATLWKQIMPLAMRASRRPGLGGRVLLGLCWGLLPCGLVYSILLTAGASGSPFWGVLVMFVFGLGTLPSMLGMSLLAPSLDSFLSDRWTRKLMGLALVLLAIYSVYLPFFSAHPVPTHQN